MYCNVDKYADGSVHGRIGAQGQDIYLFELRPIPPSDWIYRGKLTEGYFLAADVQGYEHIPQEFYVALDAAWGDPSGQHEFPDPFLDDLALAGA